MVLKNKLVIASALFVISGAAFGHAFAKSLEKAAPVYKPVQAISLEAGSKRAVGYYVAKAGVCKLTVMLTEQPGWDGVVTTTPARIQLVVAAGDNARIGTVEGKSIEFGCDADAATMSVKTLDQLADATE